MQKYSTVKIVALMVGLMLSGSARAQQTPPAKTPPSPAATAPKAATPPKKAAAPAAKSTTAPALTTPKQKGSYALGMNIGRSLKK